MSAPKKKTNPPTLNNALTGEPMASNLVEVAPNQWVPQGVHPDDVPRYALSWLMRQADGTYMPVLKVHGQYVRMSHELPAKLGLAGLHPRNLYRLVAAGFVASSRIAPNTILVDVLSLAQHIEAARDPEYWTPMRRKQWSDACTEIS